MRLGIDLICNTVVELLQGLITLQVYEIWELTKSENELITSFLT